jgi:hypothetical protein
METRLFVWEHTLLDSLSESMQIVVLSEEEDK